MNKTTKNGFNDCLNVVVWRHNRGNEKKIMEVKTKDTFSKWFGVILYLLRLLFIILLIGKRVRRSDFNLAEFR